MFILENYIHHWLSSLYKIYKEGRGQFCMQMENSSKLDIGRSATHHIRSGGTAMHAVRMVGNGVKGILGIQSTSSGGEKVGALLHTV